MQIITTNFTRAELKKAAANFFGDMIKAVVDLDRGVIAIDAELHADLESLLLENGSKQKSLWGINFYPDILGEGFVEFDSMINIRPSEGNRSRGVESADIREKILKVVAQRIVL